MRVVVGERVGGPEVLAIAEREAPRPGPGEVVVDVAAAGVNYMDIYQREGVGNYRADPPFVPGGEGAGFFFFQAEDGIRDGRVTGVQTCASSDLASRPATARCARCTASACGSSRARW